MASYVPKFRYCTLSIIISLRGSSLVLVPGCGMQLPLPNPQRLLLYAIVFRLMGPVMVELDGVIQLMLRLNISRWSGDKDALHASSATRITEARTPGGGATDPVCETGDAAWKPICGNLLN